MKTKTIIATALFALLSCTQPVPNSDKQTVTNNEKEFSYLKMNGTFKIKTYDSNTANDPRNPSKIVMQTTNEAGTLTKIAFYDHQDSTKLIAESGYKYIGSRPDPLYYPTTSKLSIWDIFERVEDYKGDGSNFQFVVSRSPHDTPIHMHLRYGKDVDELLNMSKDKEDNNFNPWWADFEEVK